MGFKHLNLMKGILRKRKKKKKFLHNAFRIVGVRLFFILVRRNFFVFLNVRYRISFSFIWVS